MAKNPLQSLALAAYDETESLLATLRACEAVAELVTAAGKRQAVATANGIGALLSLHADALDRRLSAINTTRGAIAQLIQEQLPGGSRAGAAVFHAGECIDNATEALHALESVALLAPLLDAIHSDGLGEAVRVVVGAMQEQADAMAKALEELRTSLDKELSGAAA